MTGPPPQTWTPATISLGVQKTGQACQEKRFHAEASEFGLQSAGQRPSSDPGSSRHNRIQLRWDFRRSTLNVSKFSLAGQHLVRASVEWGQGWNGPSTSDVHVAGLHQGCCRFGSHLCIRQRQGGRHLQLP